MVGKYFTYNIVVYLQRTSLIALDNGIQNFEEYHVT